MRHQGVDRDLDTVQLPTDIVQDLPAQSQRHGDTEDQKVRPVLFHRDTDLEPIARFADHVEAPGGGEARFLHGTGKTGADDLVIIGHHRGKVPNVRHGTSLRETVAEKISPRPSLAQMASARPNSSHSLRTIGRPRPDPVRL